MVHVLRNSLIDGCYIFFAIIVQLAGINESRTICFRGIVEVCSECVLLRYFVMSSFRCQWCSPHYGFHMYVGICGLCCFLSLCWPLTTFLQLCLLSFSSGSRGPEVLFAFSQRRTPVFFTWRACHYDTLDTDLLAPKGV